MTVILKLVGNQATVNLNDNSTGLIIDYQPKTPKISANYTPTTGRQGGELLDAYTENITERAKVTLLGSISTIRATLAAIQRTFEEAREFSRGYRGPSFVVSPQVWYQPDGGLGSDYISPLLDGQLEVDDDDWALVLANQQLDIELIWTRRPYWQDQNASYLTISNGSGSSSSGLTVYNHDDSGHDNYCDIAAGVILGDIPSPAVFEIKNTASDSLRNLWIGEAIYTAKQNLTLEAENGVGQTPVVDANASNGNYVSNGWSGTTKASLINWSLDATLMNYFDGNSFKALLRLRTLPSAYSDLRLSLRLEYNGTIIWQGQQVLVAVYTNAPEIIDLGVIKIPPALGGLTNYAALNLFLEAQRDTAGSHTLESDFLQLTPIDGYRQYGGLTSLATNTALIDNGGKNQVYSDLNYTGSPAQFVPLHVVWGEPFFLVPSRAHRFVFLRDRSDGRAMPLNTLSVRILYYPRYTLL